MLLSVFLFFKFIIIPIAFLLNQQIVVSGQASISVTAILSWVVPSVISIPLSYLVASITIGRKMKKEKRAYSKLWIHPKLYLDLISLKTINDTFNEGENPFCMLYDESVIRGHASMKIPCGGYDECIDRYKALMEHIQLLIDNNSNVAPFGVDKVNWEQDLDVLRAFGRMILQSEGIKTLFQTNYTYIDRWKELTCTIDNLIDNTHYSIEKTRNNK